MKRLFLLLNLCSACAINDAYASTYTTTDIPMSSKEIEERYNHFTQEMVKALEEDRYSDFGFWDKKRTEWVESLNEEERQCFDAMIAKLEASERLDREAELDDKLSSLINAYLTAQLHTDNQGMQEVLMELQDWANMLSTDDYNYVHDKIQQIYDTQLAESKTLVMGKAYIQSHLYACFLQMLATPNIYAAMAIGDELLEWAQTLSPEDSRYAMDYIDYFTSGYADQEITGERKAELEAIFTQYATEIHMAQTAGDSAKIQKTSEILREWIFSLDCAEMRYMIVFSKSLADRLNITL